MSLSTNAPQPYSDLLSALNRRNRFPSSDLRSRTAMDQATGSTANNRMTTASRGSFSDLTVSTNHHDLSTTSTRKQPSASNTVTTLPPPISSSDADPRAPMPRAPSVTIL